MLPSKGLGPLYLKYLFQWDLHCSPGNLTKTQCGNQIPIYSRKKKKKNGVWGGNKLPDVQKQHLPREGFRSGQS